MPVTVDMTVGGFNVSELLKRTGAEALEDRVPELAASAAYYFFFSLFPLLLFIAPILSFVGNKEQLITAIVQQVAPLVPVDALGVIEAALREVVFTEGAPALMSLGAFLAAFAASNVISMLTGALNIAYDVTEQRPFWKRRLLALVFVVLGGIAIALTVPVLIAGEQIIAWAGSTLGLEEQTAKVIGLLQYPVTFAVVVTILWLVYYILPNTQQNPKTVLAGAVIVTLVWVMVTLAFRLYVVNFGGYNKTYGAIGGIIILLMWMYLTMLVLLAGGELNAELHRGTGRVTVRQPILFDGRIPTVNEPAKPSAKLS